MPTIKMCANPALQQTYYRFNIQQAQSCSSEAEKVANIQRSIKALKEAKQEYLRENTKLGRLNRGLLAARLIKETCYSFLDLTSALAGDILKAGGMSDAYIKKVEVYAVGGMIAIDMFDATSKVAYGQGSWGNVIETAANSSLMGFNTVASGVPEKTYGYLGSQTMNIYTIGKGGLSGDTDQVKKATESLVFDNMTFTLEMVQKNLTDSVAKDRISWLKSGLKTVKAARRYGQVLDKALEEYRLSTEDTKRHRQVMTEMMKRSLERSEESLNQALREYHRCMRPNGPLGLG